MRLGHQRLNMNIFTVSKPFIEVAKVLGIFPMSFDGAPEKGVLKVKWFDAFIWIGTFSISVAIIFLNMKRETIFIKNSSILIWAWDILKYIDLISLLFLIAYQFLKRKNILKFLNVIHKVDEEVNSKF